MKYLILLLAVTIIIAVGCSQEQHQLQEKIINSDSVAINYFKGDGTMDTVVMVRIVRDKKVIEQLTGFITSESSKGTNKCGYDGSLHFFKMNKVVQDIDFRMGEGACSHFSYLLLGKQYTAGLSGDAKKLLLDLKK